MDKSNDCNNIWEKSLIFTHSSFGASSKDNRKSMYSDDAYAVEKLTENWVGYDRNGCSHSRLRIESTLGKLTSNPPPIQYNPNHEKLSKREVGPKLTIGTKYRDSYYDDVLEHKTSKAYIPKYSVVEGLTRSKNISPKKKPSEFQNLNLEDMRNALLPGPGSYESDNFDKLVKFNRQPQAFLAPRQNRGRPREVLDFGSLRVVTAKERSVCNGVYDLTRDPHKKKISYTIGEKRVLRNQPEKLPVGPGHYNMSKVMAIGQTSFISPHSKKDSSAAT